MNLITKIYQKIVNRLEFSVIDINRAFPLFAPYSAGKYIQRAKLSIDGINTIFSQMKYICAENYLLDRSLNSFQSIKTDAQVINLEKSFNKHGSDKANFHKYHIVYASILCEMEISKILEIGLGTNNTEIVSNMGKNGHPGASLRAFSEVLPAAQIYGADIDEAILFNNKNIQCFKLDQLCQDSWVNLKSYIGENFDMIIDDGLHTPSANLNTIINGLNIVKKGGYILIEDINPLAKPFWSIVAALISNIAVSSYVTMPDGDLLIVRKNK